MDYKFDLFDFLRKISNKNYNYFLSESDEVIDNSVPLLLMLWGMGIGKNRDYHIMALNEYVNPYIFSIKNKRLQLMLLCSALHEPNVRFNYLKKKKKESSKKADIELISKYYKISNREAKDLLNLIPKKDLKDMAGELGFNQ